MIRMIGWGLVESSGAVTDVVVIIDGIKPDPFDSTVFIPFPGLVDR